ncbi:MAG TPA: oxygenase MpaB family protein [Thermomonospora sp.]|nr:oxygenase MpaB family protein [Thermomonospora sp.]
MQYTEEHMDALRQQGDEYADAVVQKLFERGEVGRFNTLMRWFTSSDAELPDGTPEIAREYLEATRTPPDWVDWEIMERAREFFIDNSAHISTCLAFASMPIGYAVPHMAKLLSATHALEYPNRRMAETGQFTVYLMRPDAFHAGGKFVAAAQKVRLLHASIRYHLNKEDAWDVAALGTPLCQEDMLGAQMGFSLYVLDALHRLGIRMSPEGAEAYYYAWRVVGAMLGIDQGATPPDLTAARAFSDRYMVRHLGPSPEGVNLTRQLITMYQEVVPGTLVDPVVPALIRFLVGDTISDWLEVPRSPWDTIVKVAPAVFGVLEEVEDRTPYGTWLLDRVGQLVASFELSALTRGRVMHYTIPTSLKKEYGVKSPYHAAARWTPPPLSLPAH